MLLRVFVGCKVPSKLAASIPSAKGSLLSLAVQRSWQIWASSGSYLATLSDGAF